jgi:DNA-binding transcriptional LysR family regulator
MTVAERARLLAFGSGGGAGPSAGPAPGLDGGSAAAHRTRHGITLLPELTVTRELQDGELVELRLTERIRPVSIIAQWHPRLGPAEGTVRALLAVAHQAEPLSAP